MVQRGRPVAILLTLAAVALGLSVPFLGQPYLLRLATTILILGLAATSLDLLVGYGGLVSFGHAAFFGFGAYSVGLLGLVGVTSGFLVLPAAIAGSAGLALVIGALSLRASGVFFIMITLAFSQMIYYAAVAVPQLGGDNGMGISPSGFAGLVSLGNGTSLYALALASLLLVLWAMRRLVGSRFGRTLRATKDNPQRMIALGFPPYRYRLVAFVIAGALAGYAGALDANLNAYASPDLFHWTTSGDLLVMLILGGTGMLAGPLLGAGIFVVMQELLSSVITHWMLIFGPLLLIVVLTSNRGVLGLLFALERPRG